MSGKRGGHGTRHTPGGTWSDPMVGSKNLMANCPELTSVAHNLSNMAGDLNTQLARWHDDVTPADSPLAIGYWKAAVKLAEAIHRVHLGVRQFARDLAECHAQAAGKLQTSVNNYLEAEHDNVALIRKVSAGDHEKIAAELKSAAKGERGKGTRVDADDKIWQNFQVRSESFDKGSVADYRYADIRDLLENTQPEAIITAGAAHTALSGHLSDVTDTLVRHAQTMADNWSGTTAERAVGYVQKLHQTASDLHEKTAAVGRALSRYGPVLQHYKSTLPAGPQYVAPPQLPHGVSISVTSTAWQSYRAQVGANASLADQAAQQHLSELNEHIETAYHQMPTEVRKNLPKVTGGGTSGSRQAVGSPGTSGGTPAAPGSGRSGPLPGPAPAPERALGPAPGTPPVTNAGPLPGGTRLAGLTGPATMIGPPPVSPAGPGMAVPPGETLPGGLVVPAAGAGDGADGLSDPPGATDGWLTTQSTGNPAADGGVGVAGVGPSDGGASGEGMAGFPAGGAGGGTGSQGRMRQVWELEDAGTWNDPGEVPRAGEMPAISTDGVISAQSVAGDVAGPVADGPVGALPPEPAPVAEQTAADAGFPAVGDLGDQQQNASTQQAWMEDFPDLWGDDGQSTTPVIG